MLRSFEGTVDFNVAAAASLDSALNIKIPTMRSAIHVKGDSLVLMDGGIAQGDDAVVYRDGSFLHLYGAMRHHKLLRAILDVSSEQLDCNQLIRSISLPSDTLAAESDTVSTEESYSSSPRTWILNCRPISGKRRQPH